MLSKFNNRSAKIALVDPSSSLRMMLSDTIRAHGFGGLQSFGSINDLMVFLKAETVDLVFCSLELEAVKTQCNGLSLLRFFIEEPRFNHVRTVFVLTEEEEKVLGTAFSNGLLAWITKPFTKDAIVGMIQEFMDYATNADGVEAILAASYIRKWTMKNKLYADLYRLEKKLRELHPSRVDLLLPLADAARLAGDVKEAANIIKMAGLIDETLEPELQKRRALLASADSAQPAEAATEDQADPGYVMIVDPDESNHRFIQKALEDVGMKNFQCFIDGLSAVEWLDQNQEPHLILHEWKLPKLAGPYFLQRIVKKGASSSRVMVLSSLLKANDLQLLRELGVNAIVPKPLDRTEFLKTLFWTLQQERAPTEAQGFESKFRSYLKDQKGPQAQVVLKKYIELPGVPAHKKDLLNAEWSLFKEDFVAAKTGCIKFLKAVPESAFGLNLLGKILIHRGELKDALRVMEKAQKLSPLNIERLCEIADIQSSLNLVDEAQGSLGEAIELDEDAPVVQETVAKVAIQVKDTEKAKRILGELEAVEPLIAQLNNKAVLYAKSGEEAKGIELYKQILESLPENRQHLLPIVLYNYALAIVRAGDYEDAIKQLDLAKDHATDKLLKKVTSLKQKLTHALKQGLPLNLHSSSNDENDVKADKTNSKGEFENLMSDLGNFGCFNLFSVDALDEVSKKLIDKKIVLDDF